MVRGVKKLNIKNQQIPDILGLIDFNKIEQLKVSVGIYSSPTDVLRKYKSFYKILWKSDVSSYIDACIKNGIVAIDTETNDSVDPRTAKLVGLCLYTPYNRPVYVPVLHRDRISNQLIVNQVSLDELSGLLQKLSSCKCIYHNAKFDVNVLDTNCGVRLPIYWDTMVVAKLLDENIRSARLKDLYRLYIEPAQPVYNIKNFFESNETADITDFALYSALDPYDTYLLYQYQEKLLQTPSMQKLKSLVLDIEMRITEITCLMEQEGVSFNKKLAENYLESYQAKVDKKRIEINNYFLPIKDKAGSWPINPDSPDEVVKALKLLGADIADSTADTLKALSKSYPVAESLLEYRSDNHMITSFFRPLLEKINKKTDRIHANFDQLGSEDKTIKTGRFSSRDPNLQQLPAFNDSVRMCFNASNGNILLGADYSQQEPRYLSSVTNERALVDGYNLRSEEFPKGKDYYAQLASAAFKLDYWECTEFKKPKKVEEYLEVVPEDYYIELENGKTIQAKNLKLGDAVRTDAGLQKITKIISNSKGLIFEGELI